MSRIGEHLQLASRVVALITDAYDGDTLTVAADIWPDLVLPGSVRVLGIDTLDIRGAWEQEKNLALMARVGVADLAGCCCFE